MTDDEVAARLAQAKELVRAGKITLPATATPETAFGPGTEDTPGKGEVVAVEVEVLPHAIIIRYGMRAMGFGEVTIGARNNPDDTKEQHGWGRLRIDTEYMSPESIERVLIAAAPKLAALLVERDHDWLG